MDSTPTPDPSPRATIIAFVIVAAAIVGGIVLLMAARPAPVYITIVPPIPTATALPTGTPTAITVYVTGAVVQPGQLIVLPPASRVEDALEAVGGMTGDADLARVNLAALLRDGDQVHVPSAGEADTALATPSGGVLIHINTATVEELTALPGVGPALAQAIVDYRTEHGPFVDLNTLDAVSGIGPALLNDLTGLVAFD